MIKINRRHITRSLLVVFFFSGIGLCYWAINLMNSIPYPEPTTNPSGEKSSTNTEPRS